MGPKAVLTTHNVNSAFGPGTPNERIVQWWLKKFCKGDESCEDKESNGQPLEVDSDQGRVILEADPLTTAGGVAQEHNVGHSTVIWDLRQIGKVKKLSKWVPHELNENFKKSFFLKCCLLLFCATTQTISWSDCDMW